jgi:hypothetical protein
MLLLFSRCLGTEFPDNNCYDVVAWIPIPFDNNTVIMSLRGYWFPMTIILSFACCLDTDCLENNTIIIFLLGFWPVIVFPSTSRQANLFGSEQK